MEQSINQKIIEGLLQGGPKDTMGISVEKDTRAIAYCLLEILDELKSINQSLGKIAGCTSGGQLLVSSVAE